MSRKPKKPRTTPKQATTAQKSRGAVTPEEVDASKPSTSADVSGSTLDPEDSDKSAAAAEPQPDRQPAPTARDEPPAAEASERSGASIGAMADPAEASATAATTTSDEGPTEAPMLTRQSPGPASSAPVSHAMQYQSLVPPTDDIDDGWGSDDDAAVNSGPVLVAPSVPAPAQVQAQGEPAPREASAPAPTREKAAAPTAEPARESAAPNPAEGTPRLSPGFSAPRSLSPAAGISAVRTNSTPPSSQRSGAPFSARPGPSHSVPKGPASVRSSVPTRSTSNDASAPPSSQAAPAPSSTSRAGASSEAATGSVPRASRVPGSLQGSAVADPGAESRPSRAPSALRPAEPTHSAPAAESAAPTHDAVPTHSAPAAESAAPTHDAIPTHSAPAAESAAPTHDAIPTYSTPAAESVASDRNASPTDSAAPSRNATAAPVAFEPPLATAVSPSYERTEAAVGTEQSNYSAPALAIDGASSFPPPTRGRRGLWMAWLASVAAAAAIGWLAKPTPKPRPLDCTSKCERAVREALALQAPPAQAAPAPSPTPSMAPVVAPVEGADGADAQSTATVASATSPASTMPVVIETKSEDRIAVVVKSQPTNMKVWRRGKAIGRTPLVIEIGRGEHRIFEVGSPTHGVRRLSLNGDKTEVTVTLTPPPTK